MLNREANIEYLLSLVPSVKSKIYVIQVDVIYSFF